MSDNLSGSSIMRDYLKIPKKDEEIISAYSIVLEKWKKIGKLIRSESELPYSKSKIEKALDNALKVVKNKELTRDLKNARGALVFFADKKTARVNKFIEAITPYYILATIIGFILFVLITFNK